MISSTFPVSSDINDFHATGDLHGHNQSQPQLSQARLLRLEKVRQETVSATARLEKQHRRVFELDQPPRKKERQTQKNQFSYLGNISNLEKSQSSHGREGSSISTTESLNLQLENQHATEEFEKLIFQHQSDASFGHITRKALKADLFKLAMKMEPAQKEKLARKVRSHVKNLSDELQKKHHQRLERMNERSVFHPDANAQRAHTAFVAEFQAKLDVTAIEDMVLEEMLMEKKERSRRIRRINDQQQTGFMNRLTDKQQGSPTTYVNSSSPPHSPSLKGQGKQTKNLLFSSTIPKGDPLKLSDPNRFSSEVAKLNEKVGIKGAEVSDWDAFHRDILDFERFKLAQAALQKDENEPSTPAPSRTTGDIRPSDYEDLRGTNRLAKTQPEFVDFAMLNLRNPSRTKRTATLKTDSIMTDVVQHLETLPASRSKKLIGEGVHTEDYQNRFNTPFSSTGRRISDFSIHEVRSNTGGFQNTFLKGNGEFDFLELEQEGELTPRPQSPSFVKESPQSPPKEHTREERTGKDADGRGSAAPKEHHINLRSDLLVKQIEDFWYKLQVPAARRILFLQRFCDSKRAMTLKTAVGIWSVAADLIVLREKISGYIRRLGQGEIILASRIINDAEIELLMAHNCWVEMDSSEDIAIGLLTHRSGSATPSSFPATPIESARHFSSEINLLAQEGKQYDTKKLRDWIEDIFNRLTEVLSNFLLEAESKHGEIITYCGMPYTREISRIRH